LVGQVTSEPIVHITFKQTCFPYIFATQQNNLQVHPAHYKGAGLTVLCDEIPHIPYTNQLPPYNTDTMDQTDASLSPTDQLCPAHRRYYNICEKLRNLPRIPTYMCTAYLVCTDHLCVRVA